MRSTASVRHDLLERDTELDALVGLLDGSRAGNGCVGLLQGPAGIGKSSLLDAFAMVAQDRGIGVLRASGDDLVMDSSFAVVRDLLGPQVHEVGEHVFTGAARLALPVFDGRTDGGAGADAVGAVLHGLYWLLAGLAERAPLALVVDDAQALDAASARFLLYLARRIDSLPVTMVVAMRRGEAPHEIRFAQLLSQDAAQMLSLEPLSVDASSIVVRGALGPRADEALCRSCHEATQGNPFYLRELAAALKAEGGRPTVGLAQRVRALGIDAIATNVLLRLARLGTDCERLAEALAVLGAGASLRHAGTLASLDRARAAQAADAMRAGDLLATGSGLTFVHPIVREAISSQLPAARQAALHGLAARLLAADGAPAGLVAAHLLSADAFGERWVVDALRTAAREAIAHGAPEAASSYLRRAAAEPPPQDDRLDVLLELGRAEALLPTTQEFSALRDAAGLAADPRRRAEIALELALALFGVFRNSDARRVLDGALAQHPDLDPDIVERLEQAMIGGGMDDIAATPDVLARAKRHLERARRDELRDSRMLAALAAVVASTGSDAREATELARRALRDERLLSQWLDDGYVTAAWMLCLCGELVEAGGAAERGLMEAQRRGSAPMFLQLALLRADIAQRAGDLDVAEAFSERALDLGRELGAEQFGRTMLARVLIERGREQEANAMVESIEIAGGSMNGAIMLAVRGLVRTAAGHRDRGLADLLDADARTSRAGLSLSVEVPWIPTAAVTLAALGHRVEAVRVAERGLAEAVRFGAPHLHGTALSLCGSLETGDIGLTWLRDAVAMLERTPAQLDRARALLNLGIGLHVRGQRVQARDPLSQALDIAAGSGAVALADRARSELVAAGARPRRQRLAGPGALTPAELRTARMAAGGFSNREIAQALFLSTKTIETQLSSTYAKLSISGRRELHRALEHHDPVDRGPDNPPLTGMTGFGRAA